ncbi:Uncharacterized protein Rs2_01132 [Raphanus sativus]|nr:Uncharacterized protein Rs2_01132 [Raphanus sativus]
MRAPWIKNNTFDVNLKAHSLINLSTRRWNTELLREIFVPEDVRLILENQPVTSRPDGFVWTQTRSGNFTVSSAYKLAQEMKIKELYPEVLMQPSINSIKERVWKITTAPKIRTFIWKALSEALPVVDLISKRGLSIDSRCQFIWKSRNDLLFNGRRWEPEEIKEKAILDAEEWFLAQEVEEETVKKELRSASRPKRRWTPPPQGWLNCNIAFEWNKKFKAIRSCLGGKKPQRSGPVTQQKSFCKHKQSGGC